MDLGNLAGSKFVLLLAADFEDPELDLAALAKQILAAGCAYFCAWGPGCRQMHDDVDQAYLSDEHPFSDDESVVMTTWHDDETLGDAVFFAIAVADPVGKFAEGCDRTILAVADRDDWLKIAEDAANEHMGSHAI